MADITNPEAIRFCNEIVRPIAEKMRGLDVEIDAALVTWNAGIGAIIGSSAGDAIQDGREDEGVSRLTAANVAALGVEMMAFQTRCNLAGVAETISKPCVRRLQVQ